MQEIPKRTAGEINIPQEKIREIRDVSVYKNKLKNSLEKETSQTLEAVLAGAISLKASDVHFEPGEEATKVRLRLDGLLRDVFSFKKIIYDGLVSRIKLISGLKLNISNRPQDGRFSVSIGSSAIEVRTSILPSEHGETIVLRILNPQELISLEKLGLREDLLELFRKEIKKPNGMIIVTGPTGSGKTTTLYAFLKKIQNPEIKIITIEDPIEYHLEGISQTQVSRTYDFASGLRSIVRQDPDVILVGEIRDLETADISLQAALTGHLVLTTLHTNDAVGAIARLINLGAKPADVGPALNSIIAQRLLRRVCPKCVKMEKPSPEESSKIKKGLKVAPKEIKIPRAVGCSACDFTGFKGRVGIFEAFLVDKEMEELILKTVSSAALKEKAIGNGMITMYQDGLSKVLEGKTTIEEVEKATGE